MSLQGGGGTCAVCTKRYNGEVSRQTAKIDIFIQKIAGPFASCKNVVIVVLSD